MEKRTLRPLENRGGRDEEAAAAQLSNGVFACPFPSGGFVTRAVRLVDVSDLGHKRVVRVGVSKHGADGEQHYELSVIFLLSRR